MSKVSPKPSLKPSPKQSNKRPLENGNYYFNEIRCDKSKDKDKSKNKIVEEDPLEFDESYFDESEKHLQSNKKPRIEKNKEIIKEIIFDKKLVSFYNDKEVKNECIICGVDMGPDNPRQLCFKTFCPDEKI